MRKCVHVTTMYVPRARRFERPMCPYLSVFVRCVRCVRIVRPSVARVCERAPVRKEKNRAERERRENPRAEEPKPPTPDTNKTNTNQEPSPKPSKPEALEDRAPIPGLSQLGSRSVAARSTISQRPENKTRRVARNGKNSLGVVLR